MQTAATFRQQYLAHAVAAMTAGKLATYQADFITKIQHHSADQLDAMNNVQWGMMRKAAAADPKFTEPVAEAAPKAKAEPAAKKPARRKGTMPAEAEAAPVAEQPTSAPEPAPAAAVAPEPQLAAEAAPAAKKAGKAPKAERPEKPAVTVFAYRRLVAQAEQRGYFAQEQLYAYLVGPCDRHHDAAVQLIESGDQVKAGGAFNEQEAEQVNSFLKVIARHQACAHRIKHATKIK